MLTSRADVVIDRPERWAKQLSSHLAHRVPKTVTDTGDELAIGEGTGTIRAEDDTVVLLASAPDQQSLERVEHVLGSHLERFAAKEDVKVTWVR